MSDLLDGVLELTANVQDEPPNTQKPAGSGRVDEFTVTALRIDLLGYSAVVDLASASVGPKPGRTQPFPSRPASTRATGRWPAARS